MKKNSFQRFFDNINITYADLPYLYIPLLVAILLVIAGWVVWREDAVLWGIFILSTYLILATQFHLYRSTQKDLENHQKKIQAYFSLFSALDLKKSLPYMTGWAATPELALFLFEEIQKYKPKYILELGSGISTIVASYALKQNGYGAIIALDHDETFANKTRSHLKRHDVENFAKVNYCPLVSHQLDGTTWQWYDLEAVELPEKIDMLLVDGPPVKTDKNARYPALPLLIDRLSDRAIVLMHDAFRASEMKILEQWKEQFPGFQYEVSNTEKGIAILRRENVKTTKT